MANYRSALAADGYEWPAVNAFARSFGGLVLPLSGALGGTTFASISKAPFSASSVAIGEYSAKLGTALGPVGFSHFAQLLLLLGRDGRFYATFDDVLALLGDSAPEAVESLLTERIAVIPPG